LVNLNNSESKTPAQTEEKSNDAQTNNRNSSEKSTASKIPFPHEQDVPSNDQTPTPHHGTRTRKPTGFYNEKKLEKAGETHLATVNEDLLDSGGAEYALFADKQDWFHELVEEALTANLEDTPSIHEALNGPEKEKWLEAMGEELKQITKVEIFTIIETPPNTNVIDGKWVLR